MPNYSKSQRAGVQFVKVELHLALTLLRLADTESSMGDKEGTNKARALARDAYETFLRYWPVVEQHLTEEDGEEIRSLERELEKWMQPGGTVFTAPRQG